MLSLGTSVFRLSFLFSAHFVQQYLTLSEERFFLSSIVQYSAWYSRCGPRSLFGSVVLLGRIAPKASVAREVSCDHVEALAFFFHKHSAV